MGSSKPSVDPVQAAAPERAGTGVLGLDALLGGGLPRGRTYLVRGDHGSGKTTLGLQFCLAGAEQGERVLYLTTCESESEIRSIVKSHGWRADHLEVHFHDARECLGPAVEQSVFHPSEIELPRTIEALLSVIQQVDPQRLVIDSLAEIRLLAANPRWFHRQILALKEDLSNGRCTTLLTDDWVPPDQPIESIVHGTIALEQIAPDFGPDRRRLRITKLRGQAYGSGYHDFRIRTGGIEVFPRLIAAEHRGRFEAEAVSSGSPELDAMCGGGGLDRGTATLLLGPAGTGKSSVAAQFAAAAARRGERSAMYIFDERIQTLLWRAQSFGLDLEAHVDRGLVEIQQLDPAEMSPGQFSHTVREAVVGRGVRLVVIDSLAGYIHAMPNERSLVLNLHELLSFLSQRGVTVLMVLSQHGLPGNSRHHASFDLSYIADTVLLFRSYEYAGELRKAVSVYKRRAGSHERALRELAFTPEGIRIGEQLSRFHGILTGVPRFLEGSYRDDPADDQS